MSLKEILNRRPALAWILFFAVIVLVFLLGLLAASIMERRTEALVVYKPQVKIAPWEPRNEVWGAAYPREYASWLKTKESTFTSKFGGNNARDMLAEDPRLVVLWGGYPFSWDYRQARGHANAIDDIRATLRTGAPMGGEHSPMVNTCWTCKSPDVPRVMQEVGVAEFYKGKWETRGHQIVNPIGCSDCHDPATQNLRITRPALIEAFKSQGRDIKRADFNELRSLVCAQCHVNYYFKGPDKYLVFPWDKGLTVEAMEAHYDAAEFSDWTHSLSRTPMIKARHPDYEISQMGIHARRGVTCVDCHMPYVTEGGIKYTDHHVQSPLNAINRSCQTCHRQSEKELTDNVYASQERIHELRLRVEDALVRAHLEAKAAWDHGASQEEMKDVLLAIRHAQWRWDYATAGHGSSFHAPVEVARVLGSALDKAADARLFLARILAAHGVAQPIAMPDISSKEKAQAFMGIDINALRQKKDAFLGTVVTKWIEENK